MSAAGIAPGPASPISSQDQARSGGRSLRRRYPGAGLWVRERRPASRPGDDTGPAGLTGTRSQRPGTRPEPGPGPARPASPGTPIRPAPGPVSPPSPLSPPSLGLPHPVQEGSGAPAPGPDRRGAGGVRGARAPWK